MAGWTILPVTAVAILAFAIGCQGRAKDIKAGTGGLGQVVDPIQLQRELRLLMDNQLAEVTGTATDIAAAVQDRRVWENCLRWKMRTYDAYVSVLSEPDPRMAFVQAWADAAELRQYLTTGAGKEIFGDQQPAAVELAKKTEQDTLALGRKYFPSAVIDQAADDIEEVAQRTAGKVPFSSQPPTALATARKDVMTLLSLPLLPVKALQSATNTPLAIRQFTETTEDFAAIVQHLPEQTRWQTELLLLGMETSGPMAAVAREMDRLEKMQQEAADQLHNLADAIFWRLMGLAATVFVLALVYRLIVGKPRPKQAP